MIFFIHIPKTAGMTLASIIKRNYSENETYRISNGFLKNAIEEIDFLPNDRKSKLKLVYGHMEFGLHSTFPSRSFQYFTFLRNPIDRIVSHYYYVKGSSNHHLTKIVQQNNMEIEDYVISGISAELNNGQTRLLSGECATNHTINTYGTNNIEMLDKAIANIEGSSMYVGLQEYFDNSLIQLKGIVNWNTIDYTKLNVGNQKRSLPLSKKAISTIEEYNQLDIKLYEYALARFSKQKQ